MSNTIPTIRIHDLSTNEIIDREMNEEELALYQETQLEQKKIAAAKIKSEADKAALLVRLGLTEDELKTILG